MNNNDGNDGRERPDEAQEQKLHKAVKRYGLETLLTIHEYVNGPSDAGQVKAEDLQSMQFVLDILRKNLRRAIKEYRAIDAIFHWNLATHEVLAKDLGTLHWVADLLWQMYRILGREYGASKTDYVSYLKAQAKGEYVKGPKLSPTAVILTTLFTNENYARQMQLYMDMFFETVAAKRQPTTEKVKYVVDGDKVTKIEPEKKQK